MLGEATIESCLAHSRPMDVVLGRGFRALRVRRGLRQEDVARLAHVSRGMISKIERGEIAAVPLRILRAVAAALGATLELKLRWHGEGLDRLLDEAHARLVDATVVLLREAGWDVAVEISFSIWGERGSIDVLAWHKATGSLLVIEVKSVVPDSQATLHGLDRKARLARDWPRSEAGSVGTLAGCSSLGNRRPPDSGSPALAQPTTRRFPIEISKSDAGSEIRMAPSEDSCSYVMLPWVALNDRRPRASGFDAPPGRVEARILP
jgi:transcriptional regulator with XRE-family HTH domain